MRELVARAQSVGADPTDDEEQRLRKILPNVAQRLQVSADPGQTVIGSATAAALGSDAPLSPIPPVRVKGREQPVQSFLLG